jgi:hypothetical protein
VLTTLREKVRCKEVWVQGADRFRNPDEDLPEDFDARREKYSECSTKSGGKPLWVGIADTTAETPPPTRDSRPWCGFATTGAPREASSSSVASWKTKAPPQGIVDIDSLRRAGCPSALHRWRQEGFARQGSRDAPWDPG